jgi:hypothetical protein
LVVWVELYDEVGGAVEGVLDVLVVVVVAWEVVEVEVDWGIMFDWDAWVVEEVVEIVIGVVGVVGGVVEIIVDVVGVVGGVVEIIVDVVGMVGTVVRVVLPTDRVPLPKEAQKASK